MVKEIPNLGNKLKNILRIRYSVLESRLDWFDKRQASFLLPRNWGCKRGWEQPPASGCSFPDRRRRCPRSEWSRGHSSSSGWSCLCDRWRWRWSIFASRTCCRWEGCRTGGSREAPDTPSCPGWSSTMHNNPGASWKPVHYKFITHLVNYLVICEFYSNIYVLRGVQIP